MKNIVNEVQKIFTQGKFDHVLSQYVDISIWQERIANLFKRNYVENFTDFNYSRCFTIFINISKTNSKVGTEEFTDFIKINGNLYRIMVQISALAPYATYQYLKYEIIDGETQVTGSYQPFNNDMLLAGKKIEKYLKQMNHFILDEQLLLLKVPGISLEINSENVTVYNCLFDE